MTLKRTYVPFYKNIADKCVGKHYFLMRRRCWGVIRRNDASYLTSIRPTISGYDAANLR